MTPADAIIKERRIAGSQAGNPAAGKPTVRALAGAAQAYAIYLKAGTRAELVLELPANEYKAEWVDTKTGHVEKAETFRRAGGGKVFSSPGYSEDITLRVTRQTNGK